MSFFQFYGVLIIPVCENIGIIILYGLGNPIRRVIIQPYAMLPC